MKNEGLAAVKSAWGTGKHDRDYQKTLELSDKYVEEHPDEFAELRAFGDDEEARVKCIKALEAFRAAGFTESEWRVQVWLHHHFVPVSVGGTAAPVVRK